MLKNLIQIDLTESALIEMTLTQLETLKPEYLGPCDAFSIPPRNGCQSITVIEATPVGQPVTGMKRESGPACKPLYKRYCAVWIN